MSKIYLIGYMGAGKSTVGKKLAHHLDTDFLDMDDIIIDRVGMSIDELFVSYGEPYFRQVEREVLLDTSHLTSCVIATGGGAPTYRDNMDLIGILGMSIYLQLTVQQLVDRLEGQRSERPLLHDKSAAELYNHINTHLATRESYYLQAEITVNGAQTPSQLVQSMVSEMDKLYL